MPTYKIVLMRHGKAENRENWLERPDSERPLTAAGEKEMKKIARAMSRLDFEFASIWSSPYERAYATAKLVRDFGPPAAKLDTTPALRPEEDPASALETLLAGEPKGWSLWVGHEPHLSSLIGLVAFGKAQNGDLALQKGGLCALKIDKSAAGLRGDIRWWLSPKILLRIAEM